jgi:hypothetical protein
MPKPFFSDTKTTPKPEWCGHEAELWDGPAICTRKKGHAMTPVKENPSAQLHQESLEGWVWSADGKAW